MQWAADAVVLAHAAPMRVGPLTIEPAMRRVAHDDGQEAFLQPRVMQTLVALVRADGQILSRDDLMARCWSGMVVGDDAINRVMARLRRLAEGPAAGVFKVETITKVGYRLVAEGLSRPAAVPAVPALVAADTGPRLAVLAFDNLSDDKDMAYFSDGVSEEIQQTVAKAADLKVIGRTSSFQYRGTDKELKRVAAELNATHLLDGAVRRSGDRVRISAQLIECAGETTLWSDRYDRDLTDIFALQDEIAAAVAAALKAKFAKSLPAPPIDTAAYDQFLRIRNVAVRTFEIGHEWIQALETVVARAPAFASGWATLAFARAATLMTFHEAASASGVTAGQAAQAAETALRLDPRMGQAYQALANLEPWAAYGVREALHDRALAAAPNDTVVIFNATAFCVSVGRAREALRLARRAYELDPLSPRMAMVLSVSLRLAGQVDEASRVTDAALERWPDDLAFANNAVMFAGARGDAATVEGVVRSLPAAAAGDEFLQSAINLARSLAAPDPESLKRILEAEQGALQRTGTVLVSRPVYLYARGLRNEAFDLLEEASFAHLFQRGGAPPSGNRAPSVIFDPHYGFYRDPRFPRLCARLGLADYWLESGKWPDCADDVPYDFCAEVRKVAAEGLAPRL